MELGIVWPPTWLELARVGSSWLEFDQAQIFAQLEPSLPPFGHLSQLSPSCFVIVRWLCGRSQTTEYFSCELARFGGTVWPLADASFDFVTWLELAWVGSTVWPGLYACACVVRVNQPLGRVRGDINEKRNLGQISSKRRMVFSISLQLIDIFLERCSGIVLSRRILWFSAGVVIIILIATVEEDVISSCINKITVLRINFSTLWKTWKQNKSANTFVQEIGSSSRISDSWV